MKITTGFHETQQLGFTFAKALKGGEVLALYGDLGSGKTTFMQGLAKGLGIEKKILSPTFIIMRSYVIPVQIEDARMGTGIQKLGLDSRIRGNDNNVKSLYHIDLYRINGEQDVEGLGLLELMNQPENIIAIEWPDKIENILPEKRINIYFEYVGDDKRKIRIA